MNKEIEEYQDYRKKWFEENHIKSFEESKIKGALKLENAKLKQTLNEIREVVKGYMPTNQSVCKAMDEIEEILDKANIKEDENE